MVRKNRGEALSREAVAMRALARDIAGLQEMNLAQLRVRWAEAFGEVARSKNLLYLRKKIAFRMQERMEGGLSESAEARIQQLAPANLQAMPKLSVRPRPASRICQPKEGPRDPRLPTPGAVLTRVFNHFAHEVTVLDDGFQYGGRPYRSLSAIAREITGTAWNGFLFFRLIGRGGNDGR